MEKLTESNRSLKNLRTYLKNYGVFFLAQNIIMKTFFYLK